MMRYLIGTFLLGLMPLLGGCNRTNNEYVPPPPPEVTTALPVVQDVTLFIEENGQTEPVEQADVRARVTGFVNEILFRPGDPVTEGTVLYKIEPDLYDATKRSAEAAVEASKASVAVAEAALSTAKAAVKKAQSDFDRESRLLKSNAGSQSAYDAAVAERDSALAEEEAAEANIEMAKADKLKAEAELQRAELDVDYTEVEAPIGGRVSKTVVKLGNLVRESETLATVVDQSKIFANFSVSDRKVLDLMELRDRELAAKAEASAESEDAADANEVGDRKGGTPEDWAKIPVYLQRDGEDDRWFEGRMEYVDQVGIEEDTGTFGLRAVFENSARDLLPGMFVRVRVPVKVMEDAMVIPERAVTRSQGGEFVQVVGSDNKVERRQVKLGQRLDGWVIVQDGLTPEEAFVLEGLQRARPGIEVAPQRTELSTEDSPMLNASTSKPSE